MIHVHMGMPRTIVKLDFKLLEHPACSPALALSDIPSFNSLNILNKVNDFLPMDREAQKVEKGGKCLSQVITISWHGYILHLDETLVPHTITHSCYMSGVEQHERKYFAQ